MGLFQHSKKIISFELFSISRLDPYSNKKFSCFLPKSEKEKEDRRKLTPTVRTASFSLQYYPRITQLGPKGWERVVYVSEAKKSECLVHLDRF